MAVAAGADVTDKFGFSLQPRRGCFEVRDAASGKKYISLLVRASWPASCTVAHFPRPTTSKQLGSNAGWLHLHVCCCFETGVHDFLDLGILGLMLAYPYAA